MVVKSTVGEGDGGEEEKEEKKKAKAKAKTNLGRPTPLEGGHPDW